MTPKVDSAILAALSLEATTTSIASHGGKVDLIGYAGSEVHPDILQNCLINIVPIKPFPSWLQTNSRILFLLLAPLKVLYQIWSLYHALAYRTIASKWMLIQNPPSIPTLFVCQIVCFVRNTRLVIDWHNFGYSILALRLGRSHPLVKISEWYEPTAISTASYTTTIFTITTTNIHTHTHTHIRIRSTTCPCQ